MKVAVIGSRNLIIDDLKQYLPKNTTEIISGGAKGVDLCAKTYALEQNLKYTEFLPKYELYRKNAPLNRNIEIINYADFVLAFWDGSSRGTKFVIDKCKKLKKIHKIIFLDSNK